MFMQKARVAALASTLVLALAACGGAATRESIPESDVEGYATKALEKEVGVTPDKIDCPREMPAKTGEEMRCTLTQDGDSTALTVRVTSVDGAKFNLGVEVDEETAVVSKADLEKEILDQLEAESGERPAAATCPGAVAATLDVVVECVLSTATGEKYAATITVNEAEGTRIGFDIKVASEPM